MATDSESELNSEDGSIEQEPVETDPDESASTDESSEESGPRYIHVYSLSPEGYDGTCLRPLGLCELGGCCEVCTYNPDNRTKKQT